MQRREFFPNANFLLNFIHIIFREEVDMLIVISLLSRINSGIVPTKIKFAEQ